MGNPDDSVVQEIANHLRRVEDALDEAGIDEERKKMIIQTLIFGGPITSTHEMQPLPSVSQMRLALETVQTWFNAGDLRTSALHAELMMQMNQAGYPIVGSNE